MIQTISLLLQVDAAVLKQKLADLSTSGQPLLNGDQDEEIPTEEGMEEFVEHLVESLEHKTKNGQ